MSEPIVLTINIDGAARGNPGPAAFAYVIARDGVTVAEQNGCLGTATNNQAEYTALLKALEHAVSLEARRLTVFSDSELLVKQMNGEYRVKNEDLRLLFEQARTLLRKFDGVAIRHIPRSANARADALCNEALDGKKERHGPARASPRLAAVHDEAIACLQAAAQTWARGNSDEPKARLVWEQLLSILEEHGALRPARRQGKQ